MVVTFNIQNGGPEVRRDPIGHCIYCGSLTYRADSNRKLGDEHAIPEGLGGTLVLQQAACESCERSINKFEQVILKTVLHAPRIHVGIRRKRRVRAEDTIKVFAKVGNKEIEVRLPVRTTPVHLALAVLDTPGILVTPIKAGGARAFWLKKLSKGPMVPPGFQSYSPPVLDIYKFCQFLAKIAHCFAVDALGSDGFDPLLLDIIKTEAEPRYDLIGGPMIDIPPSRNLHELELSWREAGGVRYAVVRIRFFANLGAPTYLVVTGTAKAS